MVEKICKNGSCKKEVYFDIEQHYPEKGEFCGECQFREKHNLPNKEGQINGL